MYEVNQNLGLFCCRYIKSSLGQQSPLGDGWYPTPIITIVLDESRHIWSPALSPSILFASYSYISSAFCQ